MMVILAFAFGAGLVSPLNPCGFGLLPAFLGSQLGSDDERSKASMANRLWRGLAAGGAVSVGFAGVLVSAALLVALGLRSILAFVPFAAAGIGLVLIVSGVAVLAGRRIAVSKLSRLAALRTDSGNVTTRLVAFGAGYAVASVACTLAILLAVVGQALSTENFAGMVAVLAAYGAGSATLLTALSVSTAIAGSVLSARLRRVLPFMERLSGVLLVLSGAYLVATNVEGLKDLPAVDAAAMWVMDASAQASALVQSAYLWFVPVLFALLVMTALIWWRRRRSRTAGDTDPILSRTGVDPVGPREDDCCAPTHSNAPPAPASVGANESLADAETKDGTDPAR